jgi:putative solute:sodium symporter small subunit
MLHARESFRVARGARNNGNSRGDHAVARERSMDSKSEGHWRKTSSLMWLMMGLWAFFSFFIHMFVTPLNGIKIMGFPLGFYMAAQGSLVAFVIMLFWFARAQDKIDREFGVAEDE